MYGRVVFAGHLYHTAKKTAGKRNARGGVKTDTIYPSATRKRVPYRYPYRYGYDSTAALTTSIAGAGHIPGAIRLIYRGVITNPQLRLVGRVTGKTYGVCNLSVILDEGDALEYSSMYRNSYVKRIRADGQETDLLDALDLTLSPFFHVPVSEPCLLSIEADAPFTGRAELWVYYYYRSV